MQRWAILIIGLAIIGCANDTPKAATPCIGSECHNTERNSASASEAEAVDNKESCKAIGGEWIQNISWNCQCPITKPFDTLTQVCKAKLNQDTTNKTNTEVVNKSPVEEIDPGLQQKCIDMYGGTIENNKCVCKEGEVMDGDNGCVANTDPKNTADAEITAKKQKCETLGAAWSNAGCDCSGLPNLGQQLSCSALKLVTQVIENKK